MSWITHLSFQPEVQFPIKVRNKVPLISITIKAWLFICQDLETNTSVKSFNQVLFAKRRSVVWYLLELDLNYNPLSNDGLSTLSHLIFYNPHCSQGYIMERKWRRLRACFLSQLCDNLYSVPQVMTVSFTLYCSTAGYLMYANYSRIGTRFVLNIEK